MTEKRPLRANKASKQALTDQTLNDLKKKFDFGRGTEIVIATTDPKTGISKPDYFFSSKLPKLMIDTKHRKQAIDVEVSSVEQDNKELLHTLYLETRRS